MTSYRAPTGRIVRALGAAGLNDVLALPAFSGIDRGDVRAVIEGFGALAADVIAPTDRVGDREGATLDPEQGTVSTPTVIGDAFRDWVEGGWCGLTMPEDVGGGGLPTLVGTAVEEIFASANLALSLNPMLTQGAMHLLRQWGTPDQQDRYLRPLVSGRWTGTMCLTEADAGSDVGALRTTAEPRADGSWELTGTKVFITWGEHDLTENIVHLVLARTPRAPAGTRGLSLFVVPSHVVTSDGASGKRNRVRCVGLEEKLGIHASPTCVLDFDGAVGELVGPEMGGMSAMFTMMNAARLSVGIEGLAVSERALQQAAEYAGQRRQGRSPVAVDGGPSPIVEHPDVLRTLLLISTGVDAMRALLFATAAAADHAQHSADDVERNNAAARNALLTPIAKAWSTDEGVRLSSLALQVHGGAGYIEETGIAQRYRDSRIAPIYEGTNGIQSIDLVARKVRRDRGAAMRTLIEELQREVEQISTLDGGTAPCRVACDALRALSTATDHLVAFDDDVDWLAGAAPYLDLAGLAISAGLLAREANWLVGNGDPGQVTDAIDRLDFFATERLVHAPALAETVRADGGRLKASLLASSG